MKLQELPKEIQQGLIEERKTLCEKWHRNTPWEVCFVNEDGTRFFHAYRKNDFAGYGSISGWWIVRYGEIRWRHTYKNEWGFEEEKYEWVESRKTYSIAANGTQIPSDVHTKKDVLDLVKKIGIFNVK